MLSLNRLRKDIFWIIDRLKGSPIRQHYLEIQYLWNNSSGREAIAIREQNLSKLLYHAVNTTTFYKAYGNYDSLQEFPVINKNVILENYNEFKSSKFRKSELHKASSSGSTGTPFTILQDSTKRDRNTADAIYFLELAGGNLGDKLFYLKLWDYKNQKSWLTNRFQNIYAHNVMDSSKEDMEILVKALENYKSGKIIIGYPSFFEELASYLSSLAKGLEFANINTIISIAESLKDKEKALLEKYFHCRVFERYSNQENGILAQETLGNPDRLRLNWASYYFEVLKVGSNEHVKAGEVGRLVVTDIYNYAMPMIRYDTGDMVVYEEDENLDYPYISSVFGRRMDTIFDTEGNVVSPHVFYMVLDFGDIRQYQFIQVDNKSYLFKLNAKKQTVDETKIVSYFKKVLGDSAIFQFEYVEGIPLLSSGKRKKIVNEYKKS
nr:CoF synthetase [uncultured Allomuricauda sp.]